MSFSFAITSDSELTSRVRTTTGYDDEPEELPQADLDSHVETAKAELYSTTESTNWYSDVAYGQALMWLTSIVAKAAVENIVIESYEFGDGAESVAYSDASPESSQQIDLWARRMDDRLGDADVEVSSSPSPRNTSDFIG